MAWPVRPLPVLQHWDCQGCTNCCREYRVYITDAERERIAAQDWHDQDDLVDIPPIVAEGSSGSPRYRLNQRADGSCVFLSNNGRCRIHERYGADAKPLACRLYPFVLVPADNHWQVGVRFACPSVARDQGRPLDEQVSDIAPLAAELELREDVTNRVIPPPALQPGQNVDWPDLMRFVDALLALMRDRDDRVGRRWRKCLALVALCRQAKFEQVKGKRLAEFLKVVTAGLDAEVPADPRQLPAPSGIGRILFRQALAVHIRKDAGPDRGPVTQSRIALLRAAWRFATGRGTVPRLHAQLPNVTFDAMEQPTGPLPDEAEAVLERYYLVKLASLQFCGPSNFGHFFWSGLESLALTFSVILWLTRALHEIPRLGAVQGAVGIVDHNFAYSPHLGGRWQRLALRILAQRGDLANLIGWYSQ
jgi:lysine-N-methylase